ncbi:MAG: RNA polymerase sigma factor [Gemmataceae bacterium]
MTDWQRIVTDHGPAVFGAAWRVLGHAADAEDVTQDVFLEAFRQFRAQPVRSWAAFLQRLATCRALDRLRRRKSHDSLTDDLAGTNPGPADEAAGRELAHRLRKAIAWLSPQEAEVFCLRFFEDLSNQEIARELGLDPGAVAVALHKARRRLEGLLLPQPEGLTDVR